MLKILFTSVGRRVELIQAFHEAAMTADIPIWIVGADHTVSAPALSFCDEQMLTEPIDSENYIPQLLGWCKTKEIDLLIPTIDTDLLILAQNKMVFAKQGTKVLVSNADMIQICRDKKRTKDFFDLCNVKAPETVDNVTSYKGGYPCFIKPKDGSSSINAYKVETPEELDVYAKQVKNYIIQPFIEGEEYTIDIFCNFEGEMVSIVPRKRIVVRSGEVLKTQICMKRKIMEECERIIKKFQPCGPLTIQLIQSIEEQENYYIEINPRFGGGVPLSIKSGADSAKILLYLMNEGIPADYKMFIRDRAYFSRFDQSIRINTSLQELQSLSEYTPADDIKVILLDLDDTLYFEKDFVKSGFQAIAKNFKENPDFFASLWKNFENKKLAIDETLKDYNIYSETLKRELLEVYKNHEPNISLSKAVKTMLIQWRAEGYKLGIITDGEPEVQKRKIKALKLSEFVDEIIITDELGGPQFRKPCDISFRIMQRRFRADYKECVYIGDNVKKDFKAPVRLGMECIWLKNTDTIHFDGK